MMNFLREIWEVISLLIETITAGGSEAAARLALTRRKASEGDIALYFRSLKRLALVVILGPLPILLFGIVGDWEWLVATTALLWSIATLLLLLVFTPLGIILEILTGGPKGIGQRYLKVILWVLAVELTFSFFMAVVPVENNWRLLPIAGVAAGILATIAVMRRKTEWFKTIAFTIASVIFGILVFAFFFPDIAQVLWTLMGGVNDTGAERILEWSTVQVKDEATGKVGMSFRGGALAISAVALLIFVLLVTRTIRRQMRGDEESKSKGAPKGKNVGELAANVVGYLFIGILIFSVVGAAFLTASMIPAYKAKVDQLTGQEGVKYPFCDSAGLTFWGKQPIEVGLKRECWTAVTLSREWFTFDCRHIENEGLWYWSKKTRHPRWLPPNSIFPRDEKQFSLRGEGIVRCDP